MGFYSPAVLFKDAQRHGLRVKPMDVQVSEWACTIEHEDNGALSLRIGLRYAKGMREVSAQALIDSRRKDGEAIVPHAPNSSEQRITQLNIRLITKKFVGVAAWTAEQPTGLKNVVREITAPELKQFVPLPQSLHEVATIAQDFPKPSIVLSGDAATETQFKALPLSDYSVLHLALHGYVDKDYPDRSALVFAPERRGKSDGLLQAREIRNLQLNASLVTLSACDSVLARSANLELTTWLAPFWMRVHPRWSVRCGTSTTGQPRTS